jgi:hypothetical protein
MTKSAAHSPAPPEYVVDTAAPDSIARLSGAYLGDFSYLSGGDRVVVREKSITASTMVVEDRLPPLGTPGYAAARELRPLAEHLARNTGGYAVSLRQRSTRRARVHSSCARFSRGLVARRAWRLGAREGGRRRWHSSPLS